MSKAKASDENSLELYPPTNKIHSVGLPLNLGRVVLHPERSVMEKLESHKIIRGEKTSLKNIILSGLRATAESIRAGLDPTTPLHALMLEDNLYLGEIAGMMHVDPKDIHLEVLHLVDAGLVVADKTNVDHTYSIPVVEV